MTSHPSHRPVSALRARMIEDMRVRGFTEKTRSDYVRNVRALAVFIGRSPDTATAEDLRRFQLHQTQTGMQPPSINSAVAALRFFFTAWNQYYADIPCAVTVVPTKSFATVGGIVEINLIALTNGAARKKQVVETDIPR